MSITVPPVPQDEPEVAVPASDAGEAAEILALVAGLLAAEPEAGTAAARFLEARGAEPAARPGLAGRGRRAAGRRAGGRAVV